MGAMSGGIGSATARVLYERGYDLHLVGRSEDKIAGVAAEVKATFTIGDVKDSGLFRCVGDDAGDQLAGLVYAVGTVNLRSLRRLTEADFLTDFRVNAMGAALAVQAAVPALKKSTGTASVVFFSSVAALQGFGLHASISMAKAAVNGLTLSLANELAPKIRVNALAPSTVVTPLVADLLSSPQIARSIAEQHAL